MWQVDAFTDRLFGGNPAAVALLESWLPDALLQSIAAENNLPETAFVVPDGSDYGLRWFTPTVEVRLCGHATLASAHVLFAREPDRRAIRFHTRWSGVLVAVRRGDEIELDFPSRPPRGIALPVDGARALGVGAAGAWDSAEDLMVVLDHEDAVRDLKPDIAALAKLPFRGVIVTAPGRDGIDFVSRFFAPAAGVDEDPVTGSAHCVLAPYWAERLGKTTLLARQVSRRGGELRCTLAGDRVLLAGRAVTYSEGQVCV